MKKLLRIGFSILALFLLLSCETSHTPTTPDDTTNWHYMVVDTGDIAQSPVSLCVDNADNAHIAYSKYPPYFGPFIYLAHYDGSNWSFEQMAGNDAWQGMYTQVSGPTLKDDSQNILHFAYYWTFTHFITEHGLNYLNNNGGVWNTTQLDPDAFGVGHTPCLALDAQNHPHISYACTNPTAVKIADFDGVNWSISTISDSNALNNTSLAIDQQNNKHLIYADSNTHALVYAHCLGSVWQQTTISSCGGFCSLALDSSGHPHISSDNNGLEYIAWDGSSWLKTQIDSKGEFSSIAVDAFDHPYISYNNNGLKCAFFDGQSWVITALDSDTAATSIALDNAGQPHIAYVLLQTANLKYAWYQE